VLKRVRVWQILLALVVIVGLVRAIGVLITSPAPPKDPFELNGNLMTVSNRSSDDWSNVEIWLNTYYRVTTPVIRAGGRFQAPLDVFVAGFGQRFSFQKMQIHDLRMTAKRPDGELVELKKQFQLGGLAGALGGKE
jgi:hypothetical protein